MLRAYIFFAGAGAGAAAAAAALVLDFGAAAAMDDDFLPQAWRRASIF